MVGHAGTSPVASSICAAYWARIVDESVSFRLRATSPSGYVSTGLDIEEFAVHARYELRKVALSRPRRALRVVQHGLESNRSGSGGAPNPALRGIPPTVHSLAFLLLGLSGISTGVISS